MKTAIGICRGYSLRSVRKGTAKLRRPPYRDCFEITQAYGRPSLEGMGVFEGSRSVQRPTAETTTRLAKWRPSQSSSACRDADCGS